MRQRDIDQENAVLLNKIMSIMKRKNKSIMQARQNINNLSVSLNQGENQKKSLNATHCLFPQSKTQSFIDRYFSNIKSNRNKSIKFRIPSRENESPRIYCNQNNESLPLK